MKHKTFESSSEEQLIALGEEFAKELEPKALIIFKGELGAGKTTFVKGIAKGLGISRTITSPTFNIVKEYEDKLCHIDAYRINDEDIGIDDYIDRGFIVCVEWSENITDYLPYISYEIAIDYTLDGRKLEITKY